MGSGESPYFYSCLRIAGCFRGFQRITTIDLIGVRSNRLTHLDVFTDMYVYIEQRILVASSYFIWKYNAKQLYV